MRLDISVQAELWGEVGNVGVGFFGSTGICEIQGFLDAKRATNICIPLCLKGFLRSRWSVEMTGFLRGEGLVNAIGYPSER